MWKTIPGFDEHYLVNEDGEVYSLYKNDLLKPQNSLGYSVVHVRDNNGNKKCARIHRLVAIAFLGLNEELVVNHKNGNKKDNCLTNLEWVTQKENAFHRIYNIENAKSTLLNRQLSEKEEEEILELYTSGVKQKDILEKFKISSSLYKRIIQYKPKGKTFSEKNIPTIDNEIVIKVNGYDYYYISNLGNVYSSSIGKLIIPHNKNGYLFVNLYKNSRYKGYYIHRLVAEHFIEKPDGKDFVNHINENKTDNVVKNLEWVNRSENLSHSMIHTRTISDDTAKQVYDYIVQGNSISSAAKEFGISKTSAGRIFHKTERFTEK